MTEYPHKLIIRMALLETLQFSGLIISAAGVTPTMTLILLHANTISNTYLMKYVFPNRQYPIWHTRGMLLITCAIIVSLARPLLYFINGWRWIEVICSIVYIISACILGISNLYKEHCIINWKEPMDIHYISAWLYIYQAFFTLLLSPILYYLQNLSVVNRKSEPVLNYDGNVSEIQGE